MQLSSQREIRILHVDDDPSFTDLTVTFLEREDDRFAIETAISADEGMERICDCPPDCVVSDYNMPGMDGIEFLRAVREEYPDLPFILFTGKGSEAVASEAIAADVTDYLQKGSGSEKYELLANRILNAIQARRGVKQAERQEQLMRLTEFAGDTGGFELETDTGEVLLTDGACRILNAPEQAGPVYQESFENFHPDDRESIRQTIQRAPETGEQTHGTWRYQHPDAGEKLLDITFTPTTTNGDTTRIRGAVHDITDRRERQQELRQLQQAIDNADVPITLADPSQDDDPLVYVNDGFEEMTGYSPEETLGRNCRFLQGKNTDSETVAALQNAIDNEEPISVELRNYRKDGTEFWNRLTVTPIYDGDNNLTRYLGTQEDVTARKERERELAQTRDLMSNMEQLAGTGAWEYKSESETLTLTEGVRRVYGLDPGTNLTLEAAFETVHPDDRDLLEDRFKTCLETGEPYEMDARLTTPDGEQRWITVRAERVTDGEDNSMVRGYVQDITETKEREQKLALLETLFEYAEECQFIVDVADGEFELRHANQCYKRTVGLPADTPVTGQTPVELFGKTGGQQILNRYRRCVETQSSVRCTVELPVPEEETVRRTSLTPVTTNGEVTHIVGTACDTTDRIERQQDLEEYRTVVDSLADAVYVVNEEGQFTHVNDEFVELVGYERETVIGNTPSLIKDDDAVEQSERQLSRLLSSDSPQAATFEVEIHPREGDPIVCEDHMGALTYDGEEFEGSVGVLRDITEHKEYEQELEAQNERLEEFTGIVSHDLRSPLGVAESHLELAEATGESEHITKATEAIERSQALITDLLVLARGGDQVGETAPADIEKMAKSSWQTVETRQATLDAGEPGIIEADRSRLRELLENLLRNAVEHGGDGLTVSIGQLSNGFYVADTGPGIPEAERANVFRAGYSTEEEGTGFGLRIVEQIAKAHGWEVTVTESEQGGARFEFTGVERVD